MLDTVVAATYRRVASLADAWIEISPLVRYHRQSILVASLADAWIEIW